MALSGTSTLAEIQTAYLENADYQESGDVTKAKTFVTACRMLLVKMPEEADHSGERLQFDMELIRDEMKAAQSWLQAKDTSKRRAKFHDFSDYRV